MIEAVIFDMDGVIINSEKIKHEAGKRALKKFGVENYPKDVYQKGMGMKSIEFWTYIRKTLGVEPSVKEIRAPWLKEYIPLLEQMPLRDGIEELVQKMKAKGIKVALASSSDKRQIGIVIGKFKENYFDAVFSGDDVAKSKPEPQIFLKAAEKLNVPPEKCLVVEDSLHGLTAAKRAGMKCVIISTDYTQHLDLSGAEYHIDAHNEFDFKFLEE